MKNSQGFLETKIYKTFVDFCFQKIGSGIDAKTLKSSYASINDAKVSTNFISYMKNIANYTFFINPFELNNSKILGILNSSSFIFKGSIGSSKQLSSIYIYSLLLMISSSIYLSEGLKSDIPRGKLLEKKMYLLPKFPLIYFKKVNKLKIFTVNSVVFRH